MRLRGFETAYVSGAPPSTIELAALSRVAPAGDELDTFYRVRRLPDVRDCHQDSAEISLWCCCSIKAST
jgi:hypothetical protein